MEWCSEAKPFCVGSNKIKKLPKKSYNSPNPKSGGIQTAQHQMEQVLEKIFLKLNQFCMFYPSIILSTRVRKKKIIFTLFMAATSHI